MGDHGHTPMAATSTSDVERDAAFVVDANSQEEKRSPDQTATTSDESLPQPAADDASQPSPSPSSSPPPAAAADEPEAQRTRLENITIILALCMTLFLAALDVTIITTAIPTISAHFNSSLGYIWVGSAYLLGQAAFVPTWGKVSDIFGRKPVLLGAVVIFWVGSLLCAVSTSMAMLIGARVVQGIGGGGAIVLPNICISDLFSMRTRGMYFGVLGMVWAVASAVGPILGGVFTDKVSWRWCFYVNLPISGVGIAILFFVLKLHNPRTPIREGLAAIDWTGSVLVIGGTVMLLVGLETGGVSYPWSSPTPVCLIVFGVATIGLFIVNEWKVAKYPVIPIHLFRHRNSVASYALAFFHAFVFMSGSYWLPLYFQSTLRASALESGVYLLPFVLSLSVVSAITGIIIKKTGNYKILISSGMAVMLLGFGLFVDLGAKANWAKIITYQIVVGIGIGPNFQAPLIALQTNVEPRDIGSATSSFSFLRQVGTSVSVVVGGVIFNNEMQKQQAMLQRELGPRLADLLSGANAAGSVHVVAALEGHEGEVARAAYWRSLRTMYIVYTAFAAVGLVISLFIRQVKLSKEHQEHKTGLRTLRRRTGEDTTQEEEARSRVVEEK